MNDTSGKKIHLSVRMGCLLMAAVTVARGSSFLLSKHILATMEPLNLLALRFSLAFLILFVIFFKRCVTVIKKDPAILGASFLLGGVYFLVMAGELTALRITPSSTCSFLEHTAIVIVPIMEAFLLRRMPKPVIMISTVLTMIGIGLIVFRGEAAGTIAMGKGEGICLFVAVVYAIAIIMTSRMAKRYDTMVLGILYVGFLGLLGVISSFLLETPHLPQTGNEWLFLMGLVIFCSCFGFTMQPLAQEPLSSETAGIISALNPMTAALMGWLLLNEVLGVKGVIGSVLILTGILLPDLSALLHRQSAVHSTNGSAG